MTTPARGRYSQRKNRSELSKFPHFFSILLAVCVHHLLTPISCEPDWRPRPFSTLQQRQTYNTRPYKLQSPYTQRATKTRVQENTRKEPNQSRPYKPQSSLTEYEQRVKLANLDSPHSYKPTDYQSEGYQTSSKELESSHSYKPQPFIEYVPTSQQRLNEVSPPYKSQLHFDQYDQKDNRITFKELSSHRPYNLQSHHTRQKSYDNLENIIEVEELESQLLVGFSHDPYRNSLISNDFENGSNATTEAPNNKPRDKRGVLHLYNMISCATGCDPIKYKGYGCYCGFLGEGRPLDGIDQCCAMHDKCYENLFCPLYTVYFQPYYWTCYRGKPLCALENYSTRNQFINGCAAKLCECDRRLAMCLRQYRCPKGTAFCRSSPLRLLQNLLMIT